jgi:hypothetical protein
MSQPTTYQPKGRMCASCVHFFRNCSHLKFAEMPVIETDKKTGVKIVKCTEYER